MPDEVLNIIFSAFGTILTGLASFLVAKLTSWMSYKMKEKQSTNYANTLKNLVKIAVEEIYQTQVENLKKSGSFNIIAQKIVLNKCLANVKSKCSASMMEYIRTNFGDVDSYITALIEAQIYILKNNNSSASEKAVEGENN